MSVGGAVLGGYGSVDAYAGLDAASVALVDDGAAVIVVELAAGVRWRGGAAGEQQS